MYVLKSNELIKTKFSTVEENLGETCKSEWRHRCSFIKL